MSRKEPGVRLLAASLLSSRHPGSSVEGSSRWRRFFASFTTIRSTACPPSYPRDDLPQLNRYPDGQTLPTPHGIDFTPGELLGCVSGELGLRQYLEGAGHTLVVTVRQGRPRQRVRARAGRRRRRHLAALLAGLSDRRAHRQGAQPQARDHRRHRLRPRRPRRRDRARASPSPKSPTATRSASPSMS